MADRSDQEGRSPSEDQVSVLQHSLGIDRDRRNPWRNYYCASLDDPQLEALVTLGLMERGRTLNRGEERYYHVTEAGKVAAVAALPKPRSAKEQRYMRFLNLREVMPGLTFREFLNMPEATR